MNIYDAIVIGGGPAGSAFAYTAASHGKRVALLEKDPVPSSKVCGGVLGPRCIRAIQDAGLWPAVEAIPHQRLNHIAVELASGEQIDIPFPDDTTRVVNRYELDAALWRAAIAAGADGHAETIARRIEKISRIWIVSAKNSHSLELRAPWLVGADGRNSFVARHLGLEVKKARRSFCLQYRLTRHDFSPQGVHFFIFQGGYCGLSVDGTGMAHLDVISLKGREDERSLNGRLMQQPAEFVRKLKAAEFLPERPATRSPIGQGRRRAPKDRSVLLLGDAQGWVEPFTGEGISLAVESGHQLARRWIDSQKIKARFPKPSFTNRCVGFIIDKPRCAQALTRLLQLAPPVGRWMSSEVLT